MNHIVHIHLQIDVLQCSQQYSEVVELDHGVPDRIILFLSNIDNVYRNMYNDYVPFLPPLFIVVRKKL